MSGQSDDLLHRKYISNVFLTSNHLHKFPPRSEVGSSLFLSDLSFQPLHSKVSGRNEHCFRKSLVVVKLNHNQDLTKGKSYFRRDRAPLRLNHCGLRVFVLWFRMFLKPGLTKHGFRSWLRPNYKIQPLCKALQGKW